MGLAQGPLAGTDQTFLWTTQCRQQVRRVPVPRLLPDGCGESAGRLHLEKLTDLTKEENWT